MLQTVVSEFNSSDFALKYEPLFAPNVRVDALIRVISILADKQRLANTS